MVIKRKSWKPSVTTQFKVCPVPFHLDTYRGCTYGCKYCFAKDFIEFARRNRPENERTQAYLEGNRPDLLAKWLDNKITGEYNYTKAHEVALKERIPLKIGANSDPFPWIEKTERITYDILVALHKHDYPVEIQTKNPVVFADYLEELLTEIKTKPNWVVAVTLISTDEEFVKLCEPHAPTPKQRLDAIKKITDSGIPAMVKCQPAIYPKIIDDLPDLVKSVKDAGCWAMNTEGLKVRIAMPKRDQELLQKISEYLGYDIREEYRLHGQKTTADWELNDLNKLEYINGCTALCEKYGIKHFSADNSLGNVGHGCECCGTQKLRDYKIWGGSDRSDAFGHVDYESKEFGKCLVNFCRSSKYESKTIAEVCQPKPVAVTSAYSGLDKDEFRITDTCPTIQTPAGGGHIPMVYDTVPMRRVRTEKGKKIRQLNNGEMGKDHTPFDDGCRTLEQSKENVSGCITGALNKDALLGVIKAKGLVEQECTKRVHETPVEINHYLRDNKKDLTIKEIAEKLDIPVTKVEHYFRTDDSRSIPSLEIWKKLKTILSLDDKYDKEVTEQYKKMIEFEQTKRVYDSEGVSPTLNATAEQMMSDEKIMIMDCRKDEGFRERDNVSPCLTSHGDSQGGIPVPKVAQSVKTPDREPRQEGRWIKEPDEPAFTLNTQDRDSVLYCVDDGASERYQKKMIDQSPTLKSCRSDYEIGVNDQRLRRLTPTECERLQGFPDSWTKEVSDTQRYKQCGNAVTVNVIEAITRRFLEKDDKKIMKDIPRQKSLFDIE